MATALQDELLRVFPFGVDVIIDTRSIKPGEDFRIVLDKKLDSSDILLILFTDQPKASHSYTGYEVGYFSRSRAQNRFITKDIERPIIPFCIGRQFPDTAEYMEGVEIDPGDVFKLVEDPASFRVPPRAMPLNDDNVVLKLLIRIGEIVASVTGLGADQAALRSNIRDSAQRLYQSIFSYLQSRIYSEGFPERKIILRPGQFLPGTSEDEILPNATIELVGRSFELFGVLDTATRIFTWPEFVSHIPGCANRESGVSKAIVLFYRMHESDEPGLHNKGSRGASRRNPKITRRSLASGGAARLSVAWTDRGLRACEGSRHLGLKDPTQ